MSTLSEPELSKPEVLPMRLTDAFDIVVIAASAGGPAALIEIVSGLPADYPAAIIIAQHRTLDSNLANFLRAYTPLPVLDAQPGDLVQRGVIYVAPPKHHTWINPDKSLSVIPAPGMHTMSPSANLLFNSAATTYQSRTLGVILSGFLDDGAAGAFTIKHMGGRVIAQDEFTSQVPDMPMAAIALRCVDHVLPLPKIAPALVALTMLPGAVDLFHVPLTWGPPAYGFPLQTWVDSA